MARAMLGRRPAPGTVAMMNTHVRWVDLDGAVNVRDLGGLATTDGGRTRYRRILRGDNLQSLTDADVRRLVDTLGVRHIIDLRSTEEARLEGPGPLTRDGEVTIHHLSLFPEGGRFTDVEADGGLEPDAQATINRALLLDPDDQVLPWQARQAQLGAQRSIDFYLGYLRDRPESIVAALRVMAHHDGAALVHCAAGKDRTGVVTAFALEVAGVTREAIVDDYVRTGERLGPILARLRASPTYAADLDSRPDESHRPHAVTMERFLALMDERHGGPLGWLQRHGWRDADTAALRDKLVKPPP